MGFPFVTRHGRFFVVSAVSPLPIPPVVPFDLMFDDVLCEGLGLEGALLEIGMTVAVETMAIDGVAEVVVVVAAAAAAAAIASVLRDIEGRTGWKEKMLEQLCEQWNPRFAFFAETMRQGSRMVETGFAWE